MQHYCFNQHDRLSSTTTSCCCLTVTPMAELIDALKGGGSVQTGGRNDYLSVTVQTWNTCQLTHRLSGNLPACAGVFQSYKLVYSIKYTYTGRIRGPDVSQDVTNNTALLRGPAPGGTGSVEAHWWVQLWGTHHVSEEVSVAEFLQVQQVGASRRVEFLRCQTVQDWVHHSVCVCVCVCSWANGWADSLA